MLVTCTELFRSLNSKVKIGYWWNKHKDLYDRRMTEEPAGDCRLFFCRKLLNYGVNAIVSQKLYDGINISAGGSKSVVRRKGEIMDKRLKLQGFEQAKVPGYLSFAEAALKDMEDFMAPPEDAE